MHQGEEKIIGFVYG